DIFNLRVQKINKYNFDGLPAMMIQDINLWTNLMGNYGKQKEYFKEIFTSEIGQKRSEFKKLLHDTDFINAIQLSNFHLYERLLEY
ncbi:hypothetical protein OSK38_28490, partial [Escherichia coli]|nr:hypothetical protein [Escherichia coli]